MYSENPPRDVMLFCKAVLSNQMARFAPRMYVRMTRETGRGHASRSAADLAEYFERCCDDYFRALGTPVVEERDFLRGRTVLEYGPGDILGVALLLYARGAARVECVDRFPLERISALNLETYRCLLSRMSPEDRARASGAFKVRGDPASGFDPAAIEYAVTPDGLSGRSAAFDMVISRAVLEHVNDLPGTISDIARALKPGGVSVHEVDLKSHGLDRYRVFDFLTWPERVYRWMYGRKGFPNRWRVDRYRALFDATGLRVRVLTPTSTLSAGELEPILPKLAHPFRTIPLDELSWAGFWIVLDRP